MTSRVLGHVRLMRPYAWIWFDLLPAATLLVLLDPEGELGPGRLVPFLVAVILADSGVSTLNDVCDVETDRRSVEANRHGRPVACGVVSSRAATIQAVLLLVAAPLLLVAVSWPSALALAGAVVLGVAYSMPPFRLSGRSWLSIVAWVLVGSACYAAAALLTSGWFTPGALTYLVGVGFFYVVGETLAKDLRDWDNDRAAGRHTPVVVIGPRRAAILSLLGCTVGTGFFLALLAWQIDAHPLPRLVACALLLVWLHRAYNLVAALRESFRKDIARRLHEGYIRTYLWLNVILLLGIWLQRA